MSSVCAYCLETGLISPEQVLLKGDHVYLCAPLGQIVEGFLIIAPYRCVPTFAASSPETLAELKSFSDTVKDFYAKSFEAQDWTFYEQGRGGGGATVDKAGGFPLHAHLCGLPLGLELHQQLQDQFQSEIVNGFPDLISVTRDQPYIYVEAAGLSRAYVGSTPEKRLAIETSRLRQLVADLSDKPERADWRACQDGEERTALIRKWRRHVE